MSKVRSRERVRGDERLERLGRHGHGLRVPQSGILRRGRVEMGHEFGDVDARDVQRRARFYRHRGGVEERPGTLGHVQRGRHGIDV